MRFRVLSFFAATGMSALASTAALAKVPVLLIPTLSGTYVVSYTEICQGYLSGANPGSVNRAADGRATHSCIPCSTAVSGVETSEWLIPRPAVIRFSSPGRTRA